MKIQIIKARLNGKDLTPGEVIEIDDKLALRWIKKGNARFPEVKVSDSGSEDDDLSKMSKKKLLSLAKEMSVEIPDPKNASKKDIIALIEKSRKVETSENETNGEGDEADEKAEKDKEEDQA